MTTPLPTSRHALDRILVCVRTTMNLPDSLLDAPARLPRDEPSHVWTRKPSMNCSRGTSEVLDTYPFMAKSEKLETLGSQLDLARWKAMADLRLGLMKFYELINGSGVSKSEDQRIAEVRKLHVEIDEAVVRAYGCSATDPHYGFHPFPAMERWSTSLSARLELLGRLLAEIHRRAAAEGTPLGKAKGASSAVPADGQYSLFGGGA